MDFATGYKLKRPSTSDSHSMDTLEGKTAHVVEELLGAAVAFHRFHLKTSGVGSYAAHNAAGAFYEAISGLADSVAEGFQGAREILLECGHEMSIKTLNSVEDCLSYLRELSTMINELQGIMPYTEIVNDLDNIKSLINSTKYKMKFLK